MRTQVMIPALLALSVGLAACSSQPNVNLENARSNFSTLQSDPQASKVAALETKGASEMLDKAEQAYRASENEQTVDQLAYLTNQRVEVAKQTIALRSAEQNLGKASAERANARLNARDAQIGARDAQIKELQDSLNAKKTERGTLVTFGDVLFDLNRSELKPGGMNNINKLAQFLQQSPERKVIVEGYTDSTGSAAYNLSLSQLRANSVRMALVKMGVGPERITTQGYGKEYPVSGNDTPSGRSMNRRVEVTISNDNQPVAPRSTTNAG
ncbi:OmpA family protein [Pseudomonas sp.]|uniref:OmpA family protein n=1 Tax=Pseudomonas sp. TaxID=306 RepID=UPI0027314D2A|nr:OmpA family protein [Pseudomonas sp.]MDP2242571.1 OmpA family protein [Pseudomonas sp.]